MSQLKAKQLKLAAGDLIIGGATGSGTTLSATGNDDKVLRIVSGAPAWSQNDNLKSADTFNVIEATNNTGVVVSVENADGDDSVKLATFKSGSAADEAFEFSSEAGALTIAATGSATDVDLILAAKGGGDVIIGSGAGGLLQADDGEDLALKGGDGSGNLYLNGGGTGKVYYGDDAFLPELEIATKGDVAAAQTPQTRSAFAGNATVTLDDNTVVDSVIVHLNGLTLDSSTFSYNSSTHVVSFNTGVLGYTLDADDQIVVTYEVTAG